MSKTTCRWIEDHVIRVRSVYINAFKYKVDVSKGETGNSASNANTKVWFTFYSINAFSHTDAAKQAFNLASLKLQEEREGKDKETTIFVPVMASPCPACGYIAIAKPKYSGLVKDPTGSWSPLFSCEDKALAMSRCKSLAMSLKRTVKLVKE